MVLASLLHSCSSVCRVVERHEMYKLVRGKTFFGCRVRFSLSNLPEPLCAVVGADVSSYRARGC
jgi:hypothetical protein